MLYHLPAYWCFLSSSEIFLYFLHTYAFYSFFFRKIIIYIVHILTFLVFFFFTKFIFYKKLSVLITGTLTFFLFFFLFQKDFDSFCRLLFAIFLRCCFYKKLSVLITGILTFFVFCFFFFFKKTLIVFAGFYLQCFFVVVFNILQLFYIYRRTRNKFFLDIDGRIKTFVW